MKKIPVLLPVLAAALLFAACTAPGSASEPQPFVSGSAPAASAAQPSPEIVELRVMAVWYGPDTAGWWADFAEEFNRDHPDTSLRVEVLPAQDIAPTVNERILAGRAPDIVNLNGFTAYGEDGLLLPAQDFVSQEVYEKFYAALLEASTVDGVTWAVPDLAHAYALYYNTDILEAAQVGAPPATWTALGEACEQLKAYDAALCPLGVSMTDDGGEITAAAFVWGGGGSFTDAEAAWTLNSEANARALGYMAGLCQSGYTGEDPAAEDEESLLERFCAGEIAMMLGPDSFSGRIRDKNEAIHFDVAPFPVEAGEEGLYAGTMERFVCFDNDASRKKLDAIQAFFDRLYDKACYAGRARAEGGLPATSEAGAYLAASDDSLAPWLDILSKCRFCPTEKVQWEEVKKSVLAAGQEALRTGDAQAALDKAQSGFSD